MTIEDREFGEHAKAIEELEERQASILSKLDILTMLVMVSLANIPITLVV